ncbi:MAG: hypothetical protein NC308_09255 [Clostridium sp.]|nr:hypothetical protein [Bacteroides sp.]MCM1199063.1 hypothetical protein [Clostridium sp.]
MKTDKEYPATHSMATAWYIADEDGNVGIMNFEDNGPVPWNIEETDIENLLFGHEEDYRTKEYTHINLTDSQIDDLLVPEEISEDDMLFWEGVVQIDLSKEREFMDLVDGHEVNIETVVSRERGLYHIVNYGDRRPDCKGEIFQKMLSQDTILGFFHIKNFFITDDYVDGKIEFRKHFDSAPYYIYAQSYWPEFLQERLNVPSEPVKLDQLPKELRDRVLNLPIKFSNTDKLQIAQYLPVDITGMNKPAVMVDGASYGLVNTPDGKEVYVLMDMYLPDFHAYCPKRKEYGNDKCHSLSCNCGHVYMKAFTHEPKVICILSPIGQIPYDVVIKRDKITRNSLCVPYVPALPYVRKRRKFMWYTETEEEFAKRNLSELLRLSKGYIEEVIDHYKPRLIVLYESAKEVFGSVYDIGSGEICVKGESYPLIIESEQEQYHEYIESLLELPYRGAVHPLVISKDDIEKHRP